jgi:hypothetical protein
MRVKPYLKRRIYFERFETLHLNFLLLQSQQDEHLSNQIILIRKQRQLLKDD